ncbi:MAG: polysaccharide deacetylase family protein [Nostoc sp.]|uniref:polysaccharide deacetylase family protein n=1 Tax=Nostoc sp. TaxID=1180 RepID=UPI002FFD0FDB
MTDNYLKRQQIISIVAIASSITACSIAPGTSPQSGLNQPVSKIRTAQVQDPAKGQINAQLPPSAKVENPTFTVPAKFQGKTVYKVQPSNNEKVIALSIDDGPWPKTTLEMLDILKQNDVKAMKGAKPGFIVLMHDGGGNRHRTVEALPQIISGLKQQGYRFVTIPELLEMAQ